MKRLPVVPTILVALAVAAMIALGVWQLQRRTEKEALLAELARQPVDAARRDRRSRRSGDDALLFRRASAMCLRADQLASSRNGAGSAGWRHDRAVPHRR